MWVVKVDAASIKEERTNQRSRQGEKERKGEGRSCTAVLLNGKVFNHVEPSICDAFHGYLMKAPGEKRKRQETPGNATQRNEKFWDQVKEHFRELLYDHLTKTHRVCMSLLPLLPMCNKIPDSHTQPPSPLTHTDTEEPTHCERRKTAASISSLTASPIKPQ